jgi:siroheme synthase
VRLKGGDPFVFGRGAEEMLVLARAGIPVEVVPGVTTAVAAPEAAGIPVTHRSMASGFLVLTGQTGEGLNSALAAVRPASITVVVMMGLGGRDDIAREFITHGWSPETRAAIVCGASTREEWVWTGRLSDIGSPEPPDGVPGVLVVGEVVSIGEAMAAANESPAAADEVSYGRS